MNDIDLTGKPHSRSIRVFDDSLFILIDFSRKQRTRIENRKTGSAGDSPQPLQHSFFVSWLAKSHGATLF